MTLARRICDGRGCTLPTSDAALVIFNAGVTPPEGESARGGQSSTECECLPRFALLAAKAPKFVQSWEMLAAAPEDIR